MDKPRQPKDVFATRAFDTLTPEQLRELMALKSKNAELSAENRRVKAELREYGRHHPGCNAPFGSYACKCGWADVRKAALSPDVPESEEG